MGGRLRAFKLASSASADQLGARPRDPRRPTRPHRKTFADDPTDVVPSNPLPLLHLLISSRQARHPPRSNGLSSPQQAAYHVCWSRW